eukprot:GILI01001758.1.p1 GENE.GILI01001758.1~~GILI01001758.1.p1  ORF type:complete len:462 (-),score=140.85 GILI01001758.1:589-1899(-)
MDKPRPARSPEHHAPSRIEDWSVYRLPKSVEDVIRGFENRSLDTKRKILIQEGERVAFALVEALNIPDYSSSSNVPFFRFILRLVDEILCDDRYNVNYFLAVCRNPPRPADGREFLPLNMFLRMVTGADGYCVDKVARIVAFLLRSGEFPLEAVRAFITWCLSWKPSSAVSRGAVARALTIIVQNDAYRELFVKLDGFSKFVIPTYLEMIRDVQAMYKLHFILWMLSYNQECLPYFLKGNVLGHMVEVLRTHSKEKVLRVALACLKNLTNSPAHVELMVDRGLHKVVELMEKKKFSDEDLMADLVIVKDILAHNMKEFSSIERYLKELEAGVLEWSPVHTDKFWRENVMRFEDQEFKLFKQLASLLQITDAKTLAVACYDVGEFARFHPQGKSVCQRLSVKSDVMKLMSHVDPDVSKHALLAVQKMMVTQWEHIKS